MDLLSPKHVILILLIVLIVFASRKLREIGPIAKMRAGRPLRLWLVAMMAIVALMVMAFALRLGY